MGIKNAGVVTAGAFCLSQVRASAWLAAHHRYETYATAGLATQVMGQADFGIFDLARARIAAEL